MKKVFFHILFLGCFVPLRAQTDDAWPDTSARLMPQVNIMTDVSGNGYKTVKPDSLLLKTYRGKTLADLLGATGTVYVRQYAPGQISTVSMRGSSASQVQLLWNGFNLNNLTLGQTDFSLVPVTLFPSVSVHMGAMGAMGGNGVVAGSVELDSREPLPEGQTMAQAGIQAGSFGKYAADAAFAQRKGSNTFSVKPYYASAANTFDYTAANGERLRMQHARSTLYGGTMAWQHVFEKSVLRTELWYNAADRLIPATLVEPASQAEQRDRNLRVAITHNRSPDGLFHASRIGYFHDRLHYENALLSETASFFSVHNIVGETEALWKKGPGTQRFTLFASGAQAENTGYETRPSLLRASAGYFFDDTWNTSEKIWYTCTLAAKEEVNNGVFSIPVLQAGITAKGNIKAKKSSHVWQLGVNGGTVYRFPTLNDMYWSPGGNPGLLPEKGISGNGSAEYSLVPFGQRYVNFIRINVTYYQRYMYNWIMWLPHGSVWSPQNLQEVWSRGAETTVHVQAGHRLKLYAKGLLNYTLSTIQKSAIANDMSVGRQLIYTPLYNATGETGLAFEGFSLSASLAYYGYRYTSSDNYEYLEPFYLLGARCTWTRKTSRGLMDVFVAADNLLNTTYYWLAQRPALPRNASAGIAFKWLSRKTNPNINTIQP